MNLFLNMSNHYRNLKSNFIIKILKKLFIFKKAYIIFKKRTYIYIFYENKLKFAPLRAQTY